MLLGRKKKIIKLYAIFQSQNKSNNKYIGQYFIYKQKMLIKGEIKCKIEENVRNIAHRP